MKEIVCLAAFLLATHASANSEDQNHDQLIGKFKSLPYTDANCGVLYVGSTTTFVDAATDRVISVVVPCLNAQVTKDRSGAENRLSPDRAYRIKVSTTQPKGLCCFTSATDIFFLTEIEEVQ